jgi:hypothetical protein
MQDHRSNSIRIRIEFDFQQRTYPLRPAKPDRLTESKEPERPDLRYPPRNESRCFLSTIYKICPLSDLRTPLSRYSLRVWRGLGLVDTVAPSRVQLKGISWLNVNTNESR